MSLVVNLVAMRVEHVERLYEFYLQDPWGVSPSVVNGIDWLRKVVDDADQFRFSIMVGGELVGALTFSWANWRTGLVSPCMWIDKGQRGKGIGRAALAAGWELVQAEAPAVTKLLANVCGYNVASLKMAAAFFGEPEARLPNNVFHEGRWHDTVFFGKYKGGR